MENSYQKLACLATNFLYRIISPNKNANLFRQAYVANKRRRPRALTLTLPHHKHPYLMLDGKRYTLRNVSEGGVGLWVPSPLPFGLHKGNRISGDIVVDSHIYPVKLEVRHFDEKIIGLQIIHHSKELQKLFAKIMEPANYASSMKLEEVGVEDPELGFPRLWYKGDANTELVLWYNDRQNMIMGVQLVFLGRWVYRYQFKTPETGFVRDAPLTSPGFLVRNEDLLVRHETPDTDILLDASHFLSCLDKSISGHLLWQFLETGEQVFLPEIPVKNTGS